jgi:hypothetical protein
MNLQARCTSARLASPVRMLFLALLAAFVLTTPARAQPEPDDEDAPRPAQPVQVGWTDEMLDQNIFQEQGNFSAARKHLEDLLALQIEHIDRACGLTDAQKKKVRLSGRGDIKRFVNRYEEIKRKFQLVKHDQQKVFQEIWQDVSRLQIMLQSGFFLEDSFLLKSLPHTLTREQQERYQAVMNQRRAFRHRADIELAVRIMELNAPLRAAQRRALIALLLQVTKPPRKTAQYAYYALQYRLSQLPEEKLKPLFDDAQWKVVSAQLNQFKGIRQWLKQSGQLDEDGDDQAAAGQ